MRLARRAAIGFRAPTDVGAPLTEPLETR